MWNRANSEGERSMRIVIRDALLIEAWGLQTYYVAVLQPCLHFAPPRNKNATFTVSGPKRVDEVEPNIIFVEIEIRNHML